MGSLPERRFDSDAAKQLRKLKRDLVFGLFFQDGLFWEAVHDMRTHWNISAAHQLPPPDLGDLLPPGWVHPTDFSEESKRQIEPITRWGYDLDAARDRVVPEPYRDWQYFGLFWREFISACVLYDPPKKNLLSFAAWGGPQPYDREFPDVTRIMLPAVRQLRDWSKSEDAEGWYYQQIIHEVAKRLRESHGINLWPVIREVQNDLGPQLREGLREWEEEHNPFRWYISVEDAASRDDAVKAYWYARSRSKPGGRPPMDKLVAVQCAILYDEYNATDPDDGRVKRWTYETLAVEMQAFGVKNKRSAELHIEFGRKLRKMHG